MPDQTPTTVQVRHKYATVLDDTQGWRYSEEWGTDFDRWLAEHTHAAVQAERERLATAFNDLGVTYPEDVARGLAIAALITRKSAEADHA